MRIPVAPVLVLVLSIVAAPTALPGDGIDTTSRRGVPEALLASSPPAATSPAPELGKAVILSTAPKIVAEVTGLYLGGQKGKVWVGGKRAHVDSWSDERIVFQVPGSRRGGTHAVEVKTAVGEPQYPAALTVPGAPGLRAKMQFRKSRRARAERMNLRAETENVSMSFKRRQGYRGKKTWCHWVRDDDCFLWCSLERRCHDVPVRKFHYWRTGLAFPAELDDGDLPRVCTSADDFSTSPVWYDTPESYFLTDEEADTWWIVVGRDAEGRLCGEFRAVVVNVKGKSRNVSGRFAGGP